MVSTIPDFSVTSIPRSESRAKIRIDIFVFVEPNIGYVAKKRTDASFKTSVTQTAVLVYLHDIPKFV